MNKFRHLCNNGVRIKGDYKNSKGMDKKTICKILNCESIKNKITVIAKLLNIILRVNLDKT